MFTFTFTFTLLAVQKCDNRPLIRYFEHMDEQTEQNNRSIIYASV